MPIAAFVTVHAFSEVEKVARWRAIYVTMSKILRVII